MSLSDASSITQPAEQAVGRVALHARDGQVRPNKKSHQHDKQANTGPVQASDTRPCGILPRIEHHASMNRASYFKIFIALMLTATVVLFNGKAGGYLLTFGLERTVTPLAAPAVTTAQAIVVPGWSP